MDDLQFDPALKELLLRATGDPLGAFEEGAEVEEVAVVVRLRDPKADIPHLRVVSRLGPIVTGRLPLDRIVELHEHSNIASLKASREVAAPNLDVSIPAIRADPNTVAAAAQTALTGRGVIVGIIDWGCDFAHPDFLRDDGSSRLLYLWDQRGGVHPNSPRPYDYGREFGRERLSEAAAQADPYSDLGYDPAGIDRLAFGTHGTHVMSIAAGNGRGSGGVAGVAPEAELIFVHLKGRDIGPEDTLGDSVRLLEAVDYILQRAEGRPVVINCSLGSTGGPKDGTSLVERGLDAILEERPGTVVCMSTGNYFGERLHASGRLTDGGSARLRWEVPARTAEVSELEVWYPGSDEITVELIDPGGRTLATVPVGATEIVRDRGIVLASVYNRQDDPNNEDNQIDIFLWPAAPPGTWTVNLRSGSVRNGNFHAFIERDATNSQSRFHPDDADPLTTLGTICSGRHTIAVGAYDPNRPQFPLAEFSSSGPTRDGRQVPLCVAPGARIRAARSTVIDLLGRRSIGGVTIKSGTSMASPHVCGVAALIMELAGERRLPAETVRDLLLRTAQLPEGATPLHGFRYGAGCIDAAAAINATRRYLATGNYHPTADYPTGGEMDSINEETVVESSGYPEQQTRLQLPTINGAATLEWRDLTLVPGSDNRPHLYYLVTGAPEGTEAVFPLRISNNSQTRFDATWLKLRFSSAVGSGPQRRFVTVPLDNQQGEYLRWSSDPLRAGEHRDLSLKLKRQTLERAYQTDPDNPLARLEVEFHWRQGIGGSRRYHFTRRTLAFYLVHPLEMLYSSTRRFERQVRFNDPRHILYWHSIYGHEFSRSNTSPIKVAFSASTSEADERTGEVTISGSKSLTVGSSRTDTVKVEEKFKLGIDKVVQLGFEVGASATHSVTQSRSLTEQMTHAARRSASYRREFSRSLNVEATLAAPPGRIETLYAYPVFGLNRLTVVRFSGPNRLGQATARQELHDVPLLVFTHMEGKTVEVDA
ncbi:MAG: S8 family peptidase [Trueperaceae bacterium]